MTIAGAALLVAGLQLGLAALVWIGIVVMVVGLTLNVLGSTGRPTAGRRFWY